MGFGIWEWLKPDLSFDGRESEFKYCSSKNADTCVIFYKAVRKENHEFHQKLKKSGPESPRITSSTGIYMDDYLPN